MEKISCVSVITYKKHIQLLGSFLDTSQRIYLFMI